MSHGVPIGVTSLGNGSIGTIGVSKIISWINVVSTTTPANAFIYSFEGGTTANNLIAVVGTAGEKDHMVENFNNGLLAQGGAYLVTSANCSIVNIGYRSYAG